MSRLETDEAERKASKIYLILASLSAGRGACISTESKTMPRNSRLVEGPTVFSAERGTANSQKTTESKPDGKIKPRLPLNAKERPI